MTTIRLATADQLLVLTDRPVLASENQESVSIHVDFCSMWDGLGKSGVFFTEKDPTVYEVVMTDGECIVPHEVLADDGFLFIGVRGVNSDDVTIKASTLVKYTVKAGAPAGNGTTVEPTADVYQQLLTAYGVASSRLNELVASKGSGENKHESIHAYFGDGTAITDCYVNFYTDGIHVLVEASPSDTVILAGKSYALCAIPDGFKPLQENYAAFYELPFINSAYPDLHFFLGYEAGYDGVCIKYRNFGDTQIEFASNSIYLHYPLQDPYLPEVNDMRVGYNGTTYGSAGEAVREQVTALHSEIEQLANEVEDMEGGGDVSDEVIADAVDKYLQENPIGIDESLTKSGQAADAAVVGEKFTQLAGEIAKIETTPGAAGKDGTSPVISVSAITGGHRITITDVNGTKTVDVMDGEDGQDGSDGQPGADGSPGQDGADGVSVTHSWNGTTLTVTSASGTSSADLKGEKGEKGDSVKGDTGSPGADGVSPTVAVSKSGKVTTISITDKNGTKTATINDGADGSNGSSGNDGTSVTVKSVSESTADGGSNVVTFSDGKTLTVKNGSKGSTGEAGKDGADGKDYSFDPTVYGLPVLYLTGDTSPIAVSKDNKVTLDYVYGDLSGTCTLKGQGATSYKTAQALVNAGKAGKFNYTIKFDTAFEAADGWGEQQKYCLKANWIDHSHSRNVVSAKLWGLIVKSRTTENTNLSGLVNGGAVDGFPIVIMLNNEFHGLYTFNIPKDGWMFGLVEDTTKTQAVVGANDHETATQFKGELAGDESDFELEFVSDEDNADWVTTSLNTLINACINSWGGDLDDTVAQYLDWDSAIDYYIFIVLIKGTDMVDKNYLLTTFDGTKWHFTAYDIDSTYGLNWDGSGLTRAVSNINFDECAETHRVWELIKRFKTDTLKSRYNTLRSNILSETRICQYFENFAWAIPSPVLLEDVKKYPTILGSGVNGIDQIARWVRQRLETVDAWIDALPAQETPVEPEEPSEGYTNLVPTSIDTDGSVYNGTGYKDDTRLSSSGGVSSSAQSGSVTTGFMPYSSLGVVRIKGATYLNGDSSKHYYFHFYDSSKTYIYGMTATGVESGNFSTVSVVYDETTGVTTFDFSGTADSSQIGAAARSASYIRLNALGSGTDLIVTVNQEIT